MAPIAARSFTLVSTAATPAPKGSAATNGGQSASPQAMTLVPASGTAAPSSPGPRSQSLGPEDVGDQPDHGLAEQAGMLPHLLARAASSALAVEASGDGAGAIAGGADWVAGIGVSSRARYGRVCRIIIAPSTIRCMEPGLPEPAGASGQAAHDRADPRARQGPARAADTGSARGGR